MAGARDAVIIGGGHNGLVAAAYLAKNGLDTLVCERRDVVGGAAVSEHPFGPGYTVTSLSYVVSLLSPSLVRDLRLASFGYHVYPQGGPPSRPGRTADRRAARWRQRAAIRRTSPS
jgi:phytoene dehydrogenase-like protein